MKGVSGEKLSQLTGFKCTVVQVVDIGLTSFTIGRFTTDEGRVVHVVHTLGQDVLTLLYEASTTAIAGALKVGYMGRDREPEQLSMPV